MNDLCNITLGFLEFDASERRFLTNCIVNYSSEPENICGRIALIYYIYLEKIKMLFGSSDRDKSVEILEKKIYCIAEPLEEMIWMSVPAPFHCLNGHISLIPDSLVKQTSEYSFNILVSMNRLHFP